jgi:hypothetical protein
MVAAAIPLAGAGMVLSAMAQAVQSLYGMGGDINDWLDKHIENMKGSENPTISRSGRVLEMAKLGFGLGYITPVIVISVGQLLLGNTLAAMGTVATAATLSNPIAMTCAAIGAIYYGWGALSDVERNEMLEKLSKGLEVGIALISSIVSFIVDKTKEFLSSKNFEEMKQYISNAAGVFGRTLGDVTHKLTDIFTDTLDTVGKKTGEIATNAGQVLGKTGDAAGEAFVSAKQAGAKVADSTLAALDLNGDGKVDVEDFKLAIKRKTENKPST